MIADKASLYKGRTPMGVSITEDAATSVNRRHIDGVGDVRQHIPDTINVYLELASQPEPVSLPVAACP